MDSDKLKYFVRLSTSQVKANGTVSASLSLEMIEYIRHLERKNLTNTSIRPDNAQAILCPDCGKPHCKDYAHLRYKSGG